MTDEARLRIALEEQKRFNNIGNDLKAYLWDLAEWGLTGVANGKTDKPKLSDYGLKEDGTY